MQVKNRTASEVIAGALGSIAASDTNTFTNYADIAADSDILTLINAGTIQFVVNGSDLSASDSKDLLQYGAFAMKLADENASEFDVAKLVGVNNVFDNAYGQFAFSGSQTGSTTETEIPISIADEDFSGSEYTFDAANNKFIFTGGNGSKKFRISYHGIIDVSAQVGDTRSKAIVEMRDVNTPTSKVLRSYQQCYVREYQGGTNGDPDTQINNSGFTVTPTANQEFEFTLLGEYDDDNGGVELTQFSLTSFVVIVERVR